MESGFKKFPFCLYIYLLSVCKNILFCNSRLLVYKFFVIFVGAIFKAKGAKARGYNIGAAAQRHSGTKAQRYSGAKVL